MLVDLACDLEHQKSFVTALVWQDLVRKKKPTTTCFLETNPLMYIYIYYYGYYYYVFYYFLIIIIIVFIYMSINYRGKLSLIRGYHGGDHPAGWVEIRCTWKFTQTYHLSPQCSSFHLPCLFKTHITLWKTYTKSDIENGPVEIVDFPAIKW